MDINNLKKEILALSHEEKGRIDGASHAKLQPEMLADREFVTRMMPRCFEMMRWINPDLMAKMRGMMTQDEDPATPRPESGRSEETRHPE